MITRLTTQWQAEQRAFAERDLPDRDFVYVWADGVHFNVRLEEDRLCCLVIVGVRVDGTKELVAIADGYRESTESWADLLRDLKRRGMRAPALAVGDGALGFWAALREVFPDTRAQRCWVHKVANVRRALPKSAQPGARRMLAEIRDAADREHAVRAVDAFADDYGAKWPKAVAKIVDDLEPLLAFFDYPAEHWIHLKTTNPIESTFATVRLRTKVTKGPGSRAAGLAMAFKLIEAAQGPLAGGERTRTRRARPSRCTLREGGDRRTRTAGSGSRRVINQETQSTGLDDFSGEEGTPMLSVVTDEPTREHTLPSAFRSEFGLELTDRGPDEPNEGLRQPRPRPLTPAPHPATPRRLDQLCFRTLSNGDRGVLPAGWWGEVVDDLVHRSSARPTRLGPHRVPLFLRPGAFARG